MFDTPEDHISNGKIDSGIKSIEGHPEYKVNTIPKAE